MKILVAIKQVPETSNVKMDEETGTIIRQGVTSIINPLDLYALEKGIRLKEEHGGELAVVSMGPPSAVKAIKEAVAMGADTGYLISDKVFGGSDTWATSNVIAKCIKGLGHFDLLLFGERATDGDTGQVGPGVASFLGIPIITYAADFSIQNGKVFVRRLVESGYEKYRAPFPLALSVVKEIAFPRLPTLRGKKRAKAMEVPVIGNDDLKVAREKLGLKGSPTKVVKIFKPKVAREGKRIVVKSEEDALAAAEEIERFLSANNFLM